MPRCAPTRLLLILLAVIACLPAPVRAQVAERSHRLEKLYNFEETDDRGNKIGFSGNLLPRNWYIIGRRPIGEDEKFRSIPLHDDLEHRAGYPDFSEVRYDHGQYASGDFSLFLGLVGGQTGAFVQQGAVQVTAGSDYRVTARVRTSKLDHAWAELRAYFIDKAGRRIDASVRRSDPVQSEDAWADASVVLPGDFDDAAFVGIELHIVQPGRDPDNPAGDHQVVPQDIRGGAWFDDVAVWQLPSVNLATASPTNIIVAPDTPELHARVRDLTGTDLRAVLSVYDTDLRLIDRVQESVENAIWSWEPDLGGRYGWYYTELAVYEVGSNGVAMDQVARTLGAFLYLPDRSGLGGVDRSRFTLLAEDVPTADLPLIGQMMNQLGLSGVVLSGWERRATPTSTAERARELDTMVRDLQLRGGHAAVSFWPVPVELATRIGVDATDPLNILTRPSDQWMDFAKPFLSQLGQRIDTWQAGSSAHPLAFLSRDLGVDLEQARFHIRQVAPTPRLVVPWRLDQHSRPEAFSARDRYAVAWPQGVTPASLAGSMSTWPVPPSDTRLDIELADASDMSHPRRIADLMLRALQAWELQPGALGLRRPWTAAYERQRAVLPDPALGVWATLAHELDGQRIIGRMPLDDGLTALVLDGQRGGMLVVWNDDADDPVAEVTLYLGEAPIAIDPFGNESPVPEADGKHTLRVGRTPTIIRGIDKHVAIMRAGFSLDEPFIESLQVAHRRTLRITNPWPRTLNGFYTITGPANWLIQPQRMPLSIAAGDTIEVPVVLRFPIQESGGRKWLTAHFEFTAGPEYDLTLRAPMRVGLRGVEFEATAVFEPGEEPGTTDAVVTLTVINTSTDRKSLNLFAHIQGHPRTEMLVPGIEPGESVFRKIRFRNIDDQIGRFPLRVGVRESNGPAVLNHVIELERPRSEKPAGIVGAPTP